MDFGLSPGAGCAPACRVCVGFHVCVISGCGVDACGAEGCLYLFIGAVWLAWEPVLSGGSRPDSSAHAIET